jgi:hypothetical protein
MGSSLAYPKILELAEIGSNSGTQKSSSVAFVIDEAKSFITLTSGFSVIKHFSFIADEKA